MELGAIFLLLALVLLVGLYVGRPFLERRRMAVASADEHELSALMAERDRLFLALQELDFDHTLGKIPSEDYPNMRAELLRRAADVLRGLDNFAPAANQPSDAESRVEAAVAARRADAAQESPALARSDEDLESLIAARRAARTEKSGGFCPNCGKPILRSDRFCPACGKPIK